MGFNGIFDLHTATEEGGRCLNTSYVIAQNQNAVKPWRSVGNASAVNAVMITRLGFGCRCGGVGLERGMREWLSMTMTILPYQNHSAI